MQVVIMAAGLGSRLGELTTAVPKALIEAGGRPLIDYALAFARAAGGTRLTVVTGFCHADVARRVAAIREDVSIVENTAYRDGNLLSMMAGTRGLGSGGFLVMNTDHVYQPAIADKVRTACDAATDITAFCDVDRTLGADDMKVQLDGARRVTAIAKTLPRWDAGYVGMTYVPAHRRADYVATAERVLAARGRAIHVEAILAELAATGERPATADISGHRWLEIDEPHERALADEVLQRERWWSGP